MFGRKSYIFNPHGGIEPYLYESQLIFDPNTNRQLPQGAFPFPFPPPEGNQSWYHNQYPMQMNADYFPNAYPMNQNQLYSGRPNSMNQGFSQSVFQNPLQPVEQPYPQYYPQQFQNGVSFNQYPNHAVMPKQPNGMKTIMNSFKAQDGSVDINKMVNTAGQMMNAVTQVSSMIKGLGGMLKP
jgi:hypothetical protein